jgi:hypothetical protein
MWDAFVASMNTRKEYLTFEELWTCCTQEESRISAKEKPQKKYDDQAFTTRFKNFRNKRKFVSRRKPNQEKDISGKGSHYKNMKHQLSKKRNLQRRLSRMKETSSSKGNNTLLISCTYLICIVSVHILYIYPLKDNVFQEELYLWKNNKIRIDIIRYYT